MKVIRLSNSDLPCYVDDEDYSILSRYTWRIDPKGYAVAPFYSGKVYHTVRMHRLILNPGKQQVDHINGDKLDNQKENLRFCNNSQNQFNVPKKKTKREWASQYKGVQWREKTRKWLVRICVNGKRIHLGYFDDEVEAAKAYNDAAIKYHGEFAYINELEVK